jgi:predicted DNA-binding transcriptional regulator YafY
VSTFSELIKHLHRVRGYVRGFYLFDWRTRMDYDEKSARTYDNERRRIESLFNAYVRSESLRSSFADKKGKKISLMINATDITRNPLYEVWRAKEFRPSDVILHFTILDVGATQSADGFTIRDILKRIVDITSMGNFLGYQNIDIPSDSTIRGKFNEYEKAGLLTTKRVGRKNGYFLTSLRCVDLPEELRSAIDFFSEAAPFGEIGDHIRDEGKWVNKIFRFKHHFIVHTLDDEILYDLLTAMEECREVTLAMDTRKSPSPIAGTPCKILSSVQTGRRYIGMTDKAEKDGFTARRLDYINCVEMGDAIGAQTYSATLRRFDAALEKAWGVSFGISRKPETPESVVMTLYIDEKTEKFVLDRLEREGRKGKIERLRENVFSYSNEVWDSNEMMPFIVSFMGRIVSLDCEETTKQRFHEEFELMTSMYASIDSSFKIRCNDVMEGRGMKQDTRAGENILFHEMYSVYYRIVAQLMERAQNAPFSDGDIGEAIEKFGFEETEVEFFTKLRNGNIPVFCKNGDGTYSTPLKFVPRPLSFLERRWLLSILDDERMGLFLGDGEISRLKTSLGGVEPLYKKDNFHVVDATNDPDSFASSCYRKTFRTLLDALQRGKSLKIRYRARDERERDGVVEPTALQYSGKDDKFRLLCTGWRGGGKLRRIVMNLSRIVSADVCGEASLPHDAGIEPETKTAVIDLSRERDTPERAMMHFANYECVSYASEDETIAMNIKYNAEDEKEVLIRVLSFGPQIRVREPDSLVSMIKERLRRQKELKFLV